MIWTGLGTWDGNPINEPNWYAVKLSPKTAAADSLQPYDPM